MIINILKSILCWFLAVFYAFIISVVLLIVFIFKFHTKFWSPKPRPNPPNCLTSTEYGEHKFAEVNVSTVANFKTSFHSLHVAHFQGIKLHYVAKGDAQNPLMLFVHGCPEFWYSWRHQIKEFSKDYYTVAFDQRGYGDSSKPTNCSDYDMSLLVEDIRQLVKFLGRDKFTLVAHDWGALVCFEYVRKHVETLDKYVLMAAPVRDVWDDSIYSSVKQFLMSWYVFLYQLPVFPEFVLRLFDLGIFKLLELESEEDLEAYKYTFGKSGAFTGPVNYYRENVKFLYPYKRTERPKKFVPGILLLGEKDDYISEECCRQTQQYFDDLDFKLIPGANHFCNHHKPTETNRMMREFLSKSKA